MPAMNLNGTRSYRSVALALIVAVSVVGCAAAKTDENATTKNQAMWAMPLDEFFVYSPQLDNYAEQLLIADCLTSKGYQWPVPWQDTEFSEPEDFNRFGTRLFTLDLANNYGYRFAPPAHEESATLWADFRATTDTYFPNAELETEFDKCSDSARADDPDFSSNFDGVNYLSELSAQADEVVKLDDEVVSATADWRACLEPQADFTLPRDPWTEMPPQSVSDNWTLVGGKVSAEEIAVAVTDAQCRESSGLSALVYEKNWDEQKKLVDENRDELDRIRAEAIERKAELLTVVAENSPKAP